MKNIRGFLSENFQFLEVKFSVHLYMRVFVIRSETSCQTYCVSTCSFALASDRHCVVYVD